MGDQEDNMKDQSCIWLVYSHVRTPYLGHDVKIAKLESTIDAPRLLLRQVSRSQSSTPQLQHELLKVSVTLSDVSCHLHLRGHPVRALPVSAVPRQMTSAMTHTASDIRRKPLRLQAGVLSMALLSAVQTNLLLVVAEGPIQPGQLAQLAALALVLVLRHVYNGLDDPIDQPPGLLHLLPAVSLDKAVQWLLHVVTGGGGPVHVGAAAALLDGALAPDEDGGPGLGVHLPQALAAGTEDLADEVQSGEVPDGDEDLLPGQAVVSLGRPKVVWRFVAMEGLLRGGN